ncbi:MAG: carbamoyl-phosphate synthase (glutamine-hydrolyzing) small subunit [Thaumarchaeota archaeon]|nr:carbamoyl-phosphate synthase (glutamine-hydrolyzing) small subunit [Nitrososphaerota archaeon]
MKPNHDGFKAKLVLEDRSVFKGVGFGFPCKVVGEVVFNTGMVGYTENLTDPSYRGQILCLTYPLIGNYGVPSYTIKDDIGLPKYFEAEHIQPKGLAIHELSRLASHWTMEKTFDQWLYDEHIPGIHGIDTRELTKHIRVKGVMMSAMEVSNNDIDDKLLFKELNNSESYNDIHFVQETSTKSPQTYGESNKRVVLIDTGTKYSIIRNIVRMGYKVVRLPYTTTIEQVLSYKPKGVVLSSGPGDPKYCKETVKLSQDLLEREIPTLGICLGNQILALASGADTYKLKYGHRGQNKPCIDTRNGNSFVTSQNHGYCINPDSLKRTGFKLWFKNADDNTVEGIMHKNKPVIAVQFHPEASPGPYDCMFIFDMLDKMMRGEKIAKI